MKKLIYFSHIQPPETSETNNMVERKIARKEKKGGFFPLNAKNSRAITAHFQLSKLGQSNYKLHHMYNCNFLPSILE